MSTGNEELFTAFVTEANEALADMENDFLCIESAGVDIDGDLVNKVFRGIHSMKGTAGYLGLKSIGSLAHEMENVLNLVRNRELIPTSAVVDTLLRGADMLRGMVNNLESSNDVDVSEQVRALKTVVTQGTAEETQEALQRDIDVELPDGGLAFMMVPLQALVSRQKQGCHIYVVEVDFIADAEAKGLTPVDFLARLYESGELIDSYISTGGVGSLDDDLPDSLMFMMLVGSKLDREALADKLDVPDERVFPIATASQMSWGESGPTAEVPPEPAEAAAAPAPPTPTAAAAPRETPAAPPPAADARAAPAPNVSHAETSLRVNVRVLDTLMNLAGELVLGRNQLLQVVGAKLPRGIDGVAARIDQVTSELQDAIMQTRMQQVGTVFNKFPRVVRDLSGRLGKKCELIIAGKDVELDKAIIEAIGDPLTHLVRNSVDHGVESPDVRTAHGKPPTGAITLRAFHEAGKVNIAIQDNGAGIDGTRLKEKAVAKEIITADEAREMSDRDAVRLIFHPGFSTAEQLSDVSGRGVGMDVVRTNIEKLGGTVEIETEIGVGTTIGIKLPLTLAIIPSLVVRAGEERFAVPQVNIRELVRVKATEVTQRIDRVKDAEVLRLRGSLLPLVRLGTALGMQSKYFDPVPADFRDDHRERIADRRSTGQPHVPPAEDLRARDRRQDTTAGALNIIVVESGHLRYGLIVDALHDSEEIVVKPLGRHLKACECLAGATILGDGRVALILDVAGIASHCELTAVGEEAAGASDGEDGDGLEGEMQSVLLLTNDPNEHFAVPMPLISRIERIGIEQIDSVGGQDVLQYRGCSLPLLSLEHHIKALPRPDLAKLHVVVFRVADREIGLIAPELVDIRQIPTDIDGVTFSELGVMGSLIVDGNTIRLVDLFALAESAHPEWFAKRESTAEGADETGSTILLAEDSAFFRSQMTSVLEAEGYEVVGCEDGLAAWNTLQDPEHDFRIVVTDIEMPNLDGLGLARKIKSDPSFAHLPIIAVTSLAAEADIQRGIEAGIDDYQVKLDREKVIASVARHLQGARHEAGKTAESALVGARS